MNRSSSRQFDLEERTFNYAQDVRNFSQAIPKKLINIDDIKQLIRSSGSVGANYIEANEALSKKDFVMRIKISRKEAKESRYWLMLIKVEDDISLVSDKQKLIQEATEFIKIFSTILEKSK